MWNVTPSLFMNTVQRKRFSKRKNRCWNDFKQGKRDICNFDEYLPNYVRFKVWLLFFCLVFFFLLFCWKPFIERSNLIFFYMQHWFLFHFKHPSPVFPPADYLCSPDENVYNIDFTRFKIRDMETGTVLFEITKPPSTGESLSSRGDKFLFYPVKSCGKPKSGTLYFILFKKFTTNKIASICKVDVLVLKHLKMWMWLHSATVVKTAALQQQGFGFDSRPGIFLHGVNGSKTWLLS